MGNWSKTFCAKSPFKKEDPPEVDAVASTTSTNKYEQNSTDKILSSDMYNKAKSDIAEQKKQKELTDEYVYGTGKSTGPEFRNASSDKKLTMILNRTHDK
tara:strand:- start:65 stop:364 length:300 start_codon:yes stop_codon:yes gene_type:complete